MPSLATIAKKSCIDFILVLFIQNHDSVYDEAVICSILSEALAILQEELLN